MWIPIAHIEALDPSLMKRGDRADLRVVARVRADADSTGAARALSAVASRLAQQYPESGEWNSAAFMSVRDGAVGRVSQILRTLAGAVGLVLLLACANVANLTFVRGVSRSRELTIRATLGAGRWRVLRQLLTESLGVALIGCLAGLGLTAVVLAGVRRSAANELAGVEYLQVDTAALGFAAAMAFLAAVLSALVPAFRASRTAAAGVARSGTHSATDTRHDARIRGGLVVAQLAVAVVLLVGTALFVRSLQRVANVPLGFDPNNLVASAITPPPKYESAESALGLYQAVLDRVLAIPGVTHAAFINHAPLGFGGMPTSVTVEGREVSDEIGSNVAPLWRTVSADYAATMKMEMAAGRWLTRDDMRTRDAFVINETLAAQLFPNESAIGRKLVALRAARARADFGQPVRGTVVGVVKDVRSGGREAPVPPEVYVPFTLEVWPWGTLVVRTTDVGGTVPLVRDVLHEVDPAIPESRAAATFNGPGAMLDRLVALIATRRLLLATVAVFAGASLLLAAIGLYAVVAYGVSQRTREVGVRVALGATGGAITRMVLREGTRLAALGTLIGIGIALGVTRLIRGLLFDTPTTDVLSYAMTAALLLAVAVLACYLPARRAARLSPMEAIRGE
jgi:putative ABC transport system permease protein